MNSLNNIFNNEEEPETFEDVREFLHNITAINAGGCGLSALVMYRWLKKYDKLPEGTMILFLDNDYYNHENNKECLSNKQGTLKAPSHIVISLKEQYIDCANVQYNVRQRYSYILEVAEDYLVNCLNNIDTWNCMFDRNKAMKEIESELHIDLSDVCKQISFL
jgi:hypothetical protein